MTEANEKGPLAEEGPRQSDQGPGESVVNGGGEKHHYVPQFLLRRFANDPRAQKKRREVWRYTRSGVESLLTRDIGHEPGFHDGEIEALERKVSRSEWTQADFLRQVDRGGADVLRGKQQLAGRLLVTLGFRTRAQRSEMGSLISKLTRAAGEVAETSAGSAALLGSFSDSGLKDLLWEALEGHGLKREHLPPGVQPELLETEVLRMVRTFPLRADERKGLNASMQLLADRVEAGEVVDGQHQKAISYMVDESNELTRFTHSSWHLLEATEPTFVLGDMPTIAFGEDGMPDWLMKRRASRTSEAYLPIHPNRCIVACQHDGRPRMTPSEVRDAAIGISAQEFYSSYRNAHLDSSGPLIGALAHPVDEGLQQSIWNEFERRKD